ncbi:MAG: OmpH family outer membrane protein [Pseudomonadota bacterium]|nr:MAG: OmpH family outer membrane protein [Pseudomonadota bacterium]
MRWVLAALLVAAAGDALAADVKVGVVNIPRLLQEAPQADAARKRLESDFAPRDQKIVELQKKLKKSEEKLAKDAAIMSDSQRQSRERELIALKRDIKRAKEEFNEDLNLRRNEELAKLQKLVYDTIVALAKEQKYDAILGDSVLYASDRVDLTDMVLSRLRKESGAGAGSGGR